MKKYISYKIQYKKRVDEKGQTEALTTERRNREVWNFSLKAFPAKKFIMNKYLHFSYIAKNP